ncbi:MAG TPA: hypothetical protein PKG56_04120 [Chitinophagaceae bacterium]|nr:hypothetical protein [Chitinophagaceae bacterium]MCC6635653.1 hypothetical protein [Chitinophagaceae bacterium]HMZ45670.1 hypothetical protein [Chitinophagaceae bacterium]HNE92873.1 hypothetical protein [Chitinophagaceae bacterium]HNL82554.1 hypothetical protein [Chitinophagaceae bacterium]
MSYTQFPTSNSGSENKLTNSDSENKNNKNKIIYGLLILALIGSWAYIIYEKNKNKEEKILFVDRIQKDSIDRVALQLQFDMLSSKADSLTTNNQELQGSLAERASEINKLKASIASILKKKNATAAELATAQKQIAELNNKIEELYAEVETLKAQNKQLTASNEQLNEEKKKLNEEKDALNSDLDKTKKDKAHVEDVASTLHANNINITAINLKGSKEKETSKAKKADFFRISFDISENYITPSGKKALMVCVYYPDGSLSQSVGSFTDRQGNSKQYTNKMEIEYEQGRKMPVSFDWKPGNKFQTGLYKIEIYNNGFKIGEGAKKLDKSTFLGM